MHTDQPTRYVHFVRREIAPLLLQGRSSYRDAGVLGRAPLRSFSPECAVQPLFVGPDLFRGTRVAAA